MSYTTKFSTIYFKCLHHISPFWTELCLIFNQKVKLFRKLTSEDDWNPKLQGECTYNFDVDKKYHFQIKNKKGHYEVSIVVLESFKFLKLNFFGKLRFSLVERTYLWNQRPKRQSRRMWLTAKLKLLVPRKLYLYVYTMKVPRILLYQKLWM